MYKYRVVPEPYSLYDDTSFINSSSGINWLKSQYFVSSGRLPIYTGLQHGVIGPATPYGLPLNLTLLPQQLKTEGYSTHMIGKS